MNVTSSVDPKVDAQPQISRLDVFDGTWRGPVERIDVDGTVSKLTMVVRIGPMLEGTIKVLEERTYSPTGATVYHLMGVFSFDAQTQEYTLTAYSRGSVRSAAITLNSRGFYFEMPDEHGEVMRFTMALEDGQWHELVEKQRLGGAPITVRRVHLSPIAASDWPGGGFPAFS